MSPSIAMSMPLAELLGGDPPLPSALADRAVTGMSLDSRAVQPGDLFVALAGASSHGLRHAGEAAAGGAACILFEPPAPADLVPAANALPVAGLRGRLGALADRFYRAPSQALQVIGVTGTNGKTSTVQLLAQALDAGGQGPCGTIGTLGVGLGDELRAGERTTPDVIRVHATLAELRDRGARAVAMEVSSHALDQGRVDAVAFDIAVFTNLSRDHLDYHGDMASYAAAKARLFAWPGLRAAVLNIDDPFGRELARELDPALDRWTLSAAGAEARLRASEVHLDADGIAFVLHDGRASSPVASRLLGRFNVDNLLAVAGCLRALGLPLADVGQRLGALRPVPGRMNRIDAGPARPLAVVDYAHSPDALTQALQSLRAHTRGRLWCVFGCGGQRDRGKRPQMAAAAERLADRVIVTDDNPRGEPGDAIVAEILAGFEAPQQVLVERDRARAIALAIGQAAAGDVVLIAGKGHEQYQEIDRRKQPFDDATEARRALEADR
jgi:UDP-N-acetylmuramoyl-L-alanyl-D-glutamate--2,6-diaminopimelate ligase